MKNWQAKPIATADIIVSELPIRNLASSTKRKSETGWSITPSIDYFTHSLIKLSFPTPFPAGKTKARTGR